MKNIDWKDETILLQLKELVKKGLSSKEIASIMTDSLGRKIGDRAIRRVSQENGFKLQKSNNNGYNSQDKVQEERRADGTIHREKYLAMSEAESMDDAFVLKAHGFNPDKYDIVNIKTSFWQQGTTEGDKSLYASKVTVKPKKDSFNLSEFIDTLNKNVDTKEIKNKKKSDSNLVIPLFDIHFGIETFESLEDKLSQMLSIIEHGFNTTTLVVGGDFLHSNDMEKTITVKGTVLDDVDNVKALEDATKFTSILIEKGLENSKNVQIKSVGGNHDYSKQYMFIWGVKIKYPQVDVDLNINSREAFNIGNVGIMIAHGDVAVKRLPMLFATEYPDIWAKSTYRTVFTGHFHTEKLSDLEGVVLHQFGTPKKNDPYETKNGFTMTRKHLQLLVFSNTRLLETYEVE